MLTRLQHVGPLCACALGAGCLLAPPAPAADAGVEGDAPPPACPALTGLTASDPVPLAVAHPAGGDLDRLVRAGAVGGAPSLLVHDGGPAFDPTCPDRRIALGDGDLLAVAPRGPTRLLALIDRGAMLRVVEVDVGTGTETSSDEVMDATVPSEPPILAVNGETVVFGRGRNLRFGPFGATPVTAWSDVPAFSDTLLALAPVDPTTTGHGWVGTGLGSDYTMNLMTPSAVAVLDHGAGCTQFDQTDCLTTRARVVTASRRTLDDEARLVAVAVADDGYVVTLQNRGAPHRAGSAAGLVNRGLVDVEVTDLASGVGAMPWLLTLRGPASAPALLYGSVVFGAGTTTLEAPQIAELALPALDGELRLVTGRFWTAGAARTLVLGQDRGTGGLLATCLSYTPSPSVGTCAP